MAIEVRQITIRSFVSAEPNEDRNTSGPSQDSERIKGEILAECREMVLEMIRTERER